MSEHARDAQAGSPGDLALRTFSARLAGLRRTRGMSRNDLALACEGFGVSGLGPAMLGAFERGDRRPSLAQAVALADALGSTVGYLLDEASPAAASLARDVEQVLARHNAVRRAARRGPLTARQRSAVSS